MTPDRLKEIELVSLREELLQVKKCQYTFLTFEITGVGLLFGLILTALTELPADKLSFWHLLLFLFPTVIVLPSTLMIFDKGITTNRIAGYFRVQEESVIQKRPLANDNGWENNCQNFRNNMSQLTIPPNVAQGMTQGPNMFYKLVFHTSWLLLLIPFFFAVVYADRSDWKCFTGDEFIYQIVIICLIVMTICYIFNRIYKKQLVQILEGKYSILAMTLLWRQIL